MKRGLSYSEAMSYAGVKRRTFDALWRPRLNAMQQGTCLIFDRLELDELFDQLKAEAVGVVPARHTDDAPPLPPHNGARNERPIEKGTIKWAKKLPASMPANKELGKSTSIGKALDFASAASSVLKRQKAG